VLTDTALCCVLAQLERSQLTEYVEALELAAVDSMQVHQRAVCMSTLNLMPNLRTEYRIADVCTGAGGDNEIANMQNRREISVGSYDDESYYLHPQPYVYATPTCVCVLVPSPFRPP
jgi:hypothetical protein